MLENPGAVWAMPDPTIATPRASLIGPVVVAGENFAQRLSLGAPSTGWHWRIGLAGLAPVVAEADRPDLEVQFAPASAQKGPIIAFLSNGKGRVSRPVLLEASWPEGAAVPRPVLVAAIPAVVATVGDTVTVDCALAFTGYGIVYSTDYGTIDALTGLLSIPNAAADRTVTVTATNEGGARSTSFSLLVQATSLSLTASTFAGANTSVGTVWTVTPGTASGGSGGYVFAYRFLRNGAAIGAFGAGATYTLLSGDAGSTITAQVRVQDSAGAELIAPATGSAVIAGSGDTPQVVGAIADVRALTGTTITRNAVAAFSPTTGLTYTGAFSDGPLTTGWAVNPTTGAITIPTGSAVTKTVVIRATTAGGAFREISFEVQIDAPMFASTPPAFGGASPAVGVTWTVTGGVYSNRVLPITRRYRFLRDGVGISNFATSASYTFVTADDGHVISAQEEVVDSYPGLPGPQTRTFNAVGTASLVAAPPTYDAVVSSTAQLNTEVTARKTATGPVYIFLKSGDYVPWTTSHTKTNSQTAKIHVHTSRDNPARFLNGALLMSTLIGFEFDGLYFFDNRNEPTPYVLGDGRVASSGPGPWPHPSAQFVNIGTQSRDLVFRNIKSEWGFRMFSFHREWNRIAIEYCEFIRCGMDDVSFFANAGFTAAESNANVTIRHCLFDPQDAIDPPRAPSDSPNRHPDRISFQGSNIRNITIFGNTMLGRHYYSQSVFCPNAPFRQGRVTWDAGRHRNYLIAENWCIGRHSHGIMCQGIDGLTIRDNYVAAYQPSETSWDTNEGKVTPQIIIANKVNAAVIERNVAPRAVPTYRQNDTVVAASHFAGQIDSLADNTTSANGSTKPPRLAAPRPRGRWVYETSRPAAPVINVPNFSVAPGTSITINLGLYTVSALRVYYEVTESPNIASITFNGRETITVSPAANAAGQTISMSASATSTTGIGTSNFQITIGNAAPLTPPVMQSVSVTPAVGPQQQLFTGSASANPTPATWEYKWFRNEAEQSDIDNTYQPTIQQEGRIEFRARGSNGAGSTGWVSAFARIGRQQPMLRGQRLVTRATAGSIAIPLPDGTVAGDRLASVAGDGAVLVISQPGTTIETPAGFEIHGAIVPPASGADTANNYAIGVYKRVLTASDITAGSFNLNLAAGGFATLTTFGDFHSLIWSNTNFNRVASGVEVPMWLPTTLSTCYMLVVVAGSNYSVGPKLATSSPLSNARISEYMPGVTTDAVANAHGHMVMTRIVGGGSPAARTIITGSDATAGSLTTTTIEVLGPPDSTPVGGA